MERLEELPNADLLNLCTEIRDLLKEQNEHLRALRAPQIAKHRRPSTGKNVDEERRRSVHETDSQSSVSRSTTPKEDDPVTFYGLDRISYYDYPINRHLWARYCGQWTSEHRLPQWQLEVKRDTLIAGPEWKYWRLTPLSNGYLAARGIPYGRGCPDYLPEWEIVYINGECYHIDGVKLQSKIEILPDTEFQNERRLIPYSLVPSWRPGTPSLFAGSSSNSALLTSLANSRELLRDCLGNLHSAPPDNRIALTMEKDQLRLASQNQSLETYLKQTRSLLRQLYNNGGSFQIVDFDDFGKCVCYEGQFDQRSWSPLEESEWEEHDGPRSLAKTALAAEKFAINVPPVCCKLSKSAGMPAFLVSSDASPWYRVISVRGLDSLKGNDDIHLAKSSAEQFCDMIFREVEDLEMPRWLDSWEGVRANEIADMVQMHIQCRGRTETDNPFRSVRAPFHITWHQITDSNPQLNQQSHWKSGMLYNSRLTPVKNQLTKMAFTVSFNWTLDTGRPVYRPAYWTILLLAPSDFRKMNRPDNLDGCSRAPHTIPLELIEEALKKAADSWEEIGDYFNLIINTQDTIFDPAKHDRLLFDDNTFSRPRRYFWAIDCLETFIPSIAATIKEWENFWELRQNVIQESKENTKFHQDQARKAKIMTTEPYDHNALEDVKHQISRLNQLHVRFRLLRDQIETLRSALFNASAVIESRAATELGENVKLLTYVSIFYLPLSFCATLWTVDFGHNTVALTAVTVVLSAITYLIVMNLNSIARLTKAVYGTVRSRLLLSMMNDENWASTGEAFSQFKPERDNVTPSEWYMLLFSVSRVWKWLTTRRRVDQDVEEKEG